MTTAVYTCPTCGERMERDLLLFTSHTDAHIVEEIKRLNPAWVTENGFCGKCVDYYKKARLGIATNLDPNGVWHRWVLAMGGLAVSAGTGYWLYASNAPREARLILFVPFFSVLFGAVQAKTKFCAILAQKQVAAMKRRGQRMIFWSALCAAVLTAAAYFL